MKIKDRTKQDYELGELIRELNGVRLGTLLEDTKTQGKMKAHYKLEEMSKTEKDLMTALSLECVHQKRLNIDELSVYS